MKIQKWMLIFCAASAPAAAEWSIDPSMIAFGDAYYIPKHHLSVADGDADVWLRRLYLTFDLESSELPLRIRLRSETNGPDHFSSEDEYSNQLKDAYLQWDWREHQITVGKQSALTFAAIESFWQYRTLEKTAPDLQGITSRLTGVGISGPLFNEKIRYSLLSSTSGALGVDHSQRARYQASVSFALSQQLTLELYADELKPEDNSASAKTHQAFIRWNNATSRIGAHYTHRDSNGGNNGPGDTELFSVFGSTTLTPWPLILRVDRLLKPSARADDIDYMPFSPEAKSTLYILGTDYRIAPHIRLLPNLEYVDYDDHPEEHISHDVYLKLTLEVTL